MSEGQATALPTASQLWSAYWAMTEVERCDQIIALYKQHGIAGTVHDLENKQIREETIQRVRRILSEWLSAQPKKRRGK